MSVASIPVEILHLIFQWIHPSKLLKYKRLSSYFNTLLSDTHFARVVLRLHSNSTSSYAASPNHLSHSSSTSTRSATDDYKHLWLLWPHEYQAAYASLPHIASQADMEWAFLATLANPTTSIPPAIQCFTNIHTVTLTGFHGIIPSEISLLKTKLKSLTMKGNTFHSSIPSSIFQLENLETLVLRNCFLKGRLSPNIGKLRNLVHVDLSMNALSGCIPASIGRLSRLQYLDLQSNAFEGEIPVNLTSCRVLQVMNLGQNKLQGQIPSEFERLQGLTYFNAWSNNLSGPIPSTLASLKHLKHLKLAWNQFTGPIPPALKTLTSLTDMDVSNNLLDHASDARKPARSFPGLTRSWTAASVNENALWKSLAVVLGVCAVTVRFW
ncbi:hypothetical protein BJ741DRAFT_278828 [Chytriomyces cf. hyalinus JEL632]|nr:hypothetical protein BJ741DRAFT_278828 [Chytriomyces cf. hyalinus JEL632]